MKMRTALLVFSICVIKIDLLDAQTKTAGCQNLQSGIFYNYPKREVDSSYSIFIRQGNIQKEVAMPAGDTSVWEVKWKNDCNYSLTYLYGEGPFATIANGYKNKIIVDVKITESGKYILLFLVVNYESNRLDFVNLAKLAIDCTGNPFRAIFYDFH